MNEASGVKWVIYNAIPVLVRVGVREGGWGWEGGSLWTRSEQPEVVPSSLSLPPPPPPPPPPPGKCTKLKSWQTLI